VDGWIGADAKLLSSGEIPTVSDKVGPRYVLLLPGNLKPRLYTDRGSCTALVPAAKPRSADESKGISSASRPVQREPVRGAAECTVELSVERLWQRAAGSRFIE